MLCTCVVDRMQVYHVAPPARVQLPSPSEAADTAMEAACSA